MKKNVRKLSLSQRLMAFALALVMVVGYIPAAASADTTVVPGTVTTVSDPETLTRPETIYGNSTLNAGKVTVGKSVNDGTTSIEYGTGKTQSFTPAEDNFIVTISQSAQVMGLSSETAVPIDAVFVLDTSGSMDDDNRAENLVTAANSAIAALMKANENNRVAVVAFSSGGYGDGAGGNDNNDNEFPATTLLSPLAHYTGAAASSHLQWVNSSGGTNGYNRSYIAGRNANGTRGSYRHGYEGGTNIQAGIVEGAKILTSANPTLTYADGTTVTRMPVLIIISDGQPTFSCTGSTWYNPTIPDERGEENGPGSGAYEGNGFLAALTAAYYKGAITERYYGANASEDNRCSVYTVGVDIEALDDYENNRGQMVSYVDDNQALAETTLDPVSAIAGTANSTYYTYGNSWNEENNRDRSETNGFKNYWDKYVAGSGYTIRTNNNQTYTITGTSITNSKNYVMGNSSTGTAMYEGGLGYNDAYYSAESGDLNNVFTSLVTEISKKAMSSPTHVTVGGDHNFEGYVTFTDPIGEYMEVKDMKGVLANGNFYQGTRFTELLKSGADAEFNAMLRNVLKTRMSMTDVQATDAFLNDFISKASAAATDNSITWWGNEYHTGEEDVSVQVMAHAADDSIEYIESARAAGTIPEGADYVCRSYFFYGTAGGAAVNPNHEYMYFMVRVQRSLTAPYQETVVISAPASLLSVDEVFITESTDEDGNKVYTADVNDVYPARVIYEVGLRSDINAQNVASIVSADYANETVNGEGSVNYDPATDTYTFFTNDWDRSKSLESHERAMAKATFDAASDNGFYTYQEDTLLLNADGTPYTGSSVAGQTLYYARDVYTWGTTPNSDGTYPASKNANPTLIAVTLPSSIPAGSTAIKQVNGNWYISKGVYAGSTLQVTGDDAIKDDLDTETYGDGNYTGTSSIVAHPMRTGSSNNSHYTVLLGNNGKLSLVAEPSKTVDITDVSGVTIENANGEPVMVGETLTYRIKVTNPDEANATTATITDSIPAGTSFVENSAAIIRGENTQSLTIAPVDGVLTWENVALAAGETIYATFQVTVTVDALSGAQDVEKIENAATVKIGTNPSYTTNTTENPPEGKKVVDSSGNDFADDAVLKVGDILVYRIRYYNNAVDPTTHLPVAADITITDIIPTGTTYVTNSASHGGMLTTDEDGDPILKWVLEDVAAGASGVVSFRVVVDASAKVTAEDTQPTTGTIELKNDATIAVGENDPRQTNETTSTAGVGDLSIIKAFAEGTDGFADKTFKLILSESTGKLNGTYVLDSSVDGRDGTVTFVNGINTTDVTIIKDETITIKGLPLGAVISVSEDVSDMPGWTPDYSAASAVVDGDADIDLTVTNTYSTTPVEFQLKGTKTIGSANFPNGTFTFHATLTDENGVVITGENARQVTATATVTDAANGAVVNFAFSPRTFTEEGTFYYLIEEVPSAIPGVTSDSTQYLLKLEITDVNSQLTATTSYKTRANAEAAWSNEWTSLDWQNAALNFTNTYTPADASVTIEGTKDLEGRSLAANEFSFQLVYGQNVIATANNAAGGSFSFPAITIDAEDMGGEKTKTFTYYIREVVGSLGYVDYDRAYYQVDVTISDTNGQLSETSRVIKKYVMKADGTYDTENVETVTAIAYTNKYNTQDVQVHLSGTKTLTGEAANGLNAEDFTFEVVDENGNVVATAGNAADGSITFSPINYTREMFAQGETEKEFTYTVKEVIPASSEPSFDVNMKYDAKEYTVVVKVTLNESTGVLTAEIVSVDGTNLDASTTSYGDLDFTNIKNPATTSVTPAGVKTTTSSGKVPAGLSFSFAVRNAADGSEAGVGVSTATTADGTNENLTITFSALVYDHEDVGNTYYYWIYESNSAANNGVQYSDARYLMKVVVSRDADNKIVATETYYNAGKIGDNGDAASYAVDANIVNGAPSFTNIYNASGHINLTALKTVNGKAPNNLSFDFKLVRDDVPGSEIAGVSHPTTGVITFGTLNYSYAAEFPEGSADTKDITYTLTEIEPNTAKIPGITYNKSEYKIVITLTHDSEGNINAAVKSVTQTKNEKGEAVNNALTQPAAGDPVALGVTFENPYTVATGTEATITATKTLSGRALANNEFSFELFRWTGTEEVLVETATNKDGGVITFTRSYPATISSDYFVDTDGDNFKDTATFIYHMDEVDTQMGGITYSGADYWIQVVIEHDQDTASLKPVSVKYFEDYDTTTGDFSGWIEDPTKVVFANTYTTNDTSFTPEAFRKILLGANGEALDQTNFANTLSFQVVEVDKNGEIVKVPASEGSTNMIEPVVSTGNNNADGRITFSPIGYTDDGTHYYLIREVGGTDPTITYNPTNTVYYLKVVVVDDGKGVLSVASYEYGTALTDGVISGTVTDAPFTNHYGPGYVTIDLGLTKDVQEMDENGKPISTQYVLKDGEFDFNVYEYSETAEGNLGDYVTSGTNDAAGNINFGSIVVTREEVYAPNSVSTAAASKEFKYVVVEEVPSDAAAKGITTADPIIVTVTVTDDGYGNLTQTEITYSGSSDKGEFVNTYKPTPTTLTLTGTKVLLNKHLTEGEFQFQLKDSEGNVVGEAVSNAAGTTDNPYLGTVTFPELTFNQPGTYTYTVNEVKGADENYVYDETVFTVIITVTDDVTGQLHAVAAYSKPNAEGTQETVGGIIFNNSYTPGSITKDLDLDLKLDAQKQIVDKGGNSITGDGMLAGFKFVVTDIHGTEVTTGVSDATGHIDFGSITFEQAGEYHYYITEVPDVKPGYIEDANTWAVHILVTYDEASGELQIKPENVTTHLVVSTGNEGASAQAEANPVFVNIYDPEPTNLTLAAAKIMTGRDLRDGEFTFHLVQKDAEGEYSIMAGSATNDAEGNVRFYLDYDVSDMLDANGKYMTQKTFVYQVHEHTPEDAVDGVKDGVTYAANTTEIQITVKDMDGELKAYINGVEAILASAGSFVNNYTAAPVDVVLKAEKTLSGAELAAGAFDFELVDSEGKVLQTVKNAADGSITFEKITITQDLLEKAVSKEFAYTIREKAGSVEGMTYDDAVYTATITVTDDQKGTLSAEVVYSTAAGTEIPVFQNKYEDPTPPTPDEPEITPVLAVISAQKTLTGRTLANNEFTFELVDGAGKVLTASNDTQGNISFSITYNEAGTYEYVLREKVGSEAGMTYDTNSYKVTVTVTQAEDGVLSAAIAYGTTDGKAPVFKNSFAPVPVSVVLEGKKVLNGRTMKEGEFKFQVKDSTGALVATGTNDADGNIEFTAIVLPTTGKYVLTVTEVDSKAWFMTYDDTKFTVTINVQEKDNVLKAEVTYPTNGIKFVNTYKYNSSATPGTGDSTPVFMLIGLMTLSAAAIVVLLFLLRKPRKRGKYTN